MKLIINIPEEVYKNIQNKSTEIQAKGYTLENAVLNGIPLPKGHGKLKDFDKIEWYGCNFEGKACERANGDCSVCIFGICDAKQVRELPTIIEADKEVEK